VIIRFVLALATSLCSAAAAWAQGYPVKPVRMVVPFIAGSAPDLLARQVSERLAQVLGQPVVVDNRGGAGGNIGAEAVAKAPPDGYTLMLSTSSHVVNPHLYRKVGYDPLKDFAHISIIARMASLMVVTPSLPARSVSELVAHAKANPGKLVYASGGHGSLAHLSAETFRIATGVNLVHVPYKGAPEIMTSLLSENSDLAFPTFSIALPHVRAGKLHALAVTSGKRNPQLPEVPTMLEAIPTGFELDAWFGIWGPSGMPAPIVARLHGQLAKMLNEQDFRIRMSSDGTEVAASASPEEFAAFVRAEFEKWGRVVRDSGAKID
jgi:tripartite-type tricarboxylate transporter receptor subunit TctC